MASFQCSSHDAHITRAVKSVVATSVGHLDELLLDGLTVLELLGVHEVGSTKLICPLLLAVIYIHNDNLARSILDTALNDGETNASGTEDGDVTALLNTTLASSDDRGTVTSCDTATEQACTVHGGLVGNFDNGNVGDDGVLGESRGAHEVKKVLALALKARGAIGHDTLALGCSDLATEIGLARLAELALFAFRGAGG